MTRTVSLSPLTVLPCSPLEQIEAAQAVGFTTVGLRVFPVMKTDHDVLPDLRLLREVSRRLRDGGTSVFDVEVVRVSARLDIDSLGPALDFAGEIGAQRLAVTSGAVADHEGEARPALADTLHRLAEAAAGRGVGVMLEFIPYRHIRTLGQALKLVEEADHPGLAITADALHFFRSDGRIEELASVPPHLLACVQLCDAPIEPPRDLPREARYGRLLPGEGQLPLVDFMRAVPPWLPVCAEIPGSRATPVVERARAALQSVQRVLGAVDAAG